MTTKWKDRTYGLVAAVILMILSSATTWYITKEDEEKVQLNEKLKQDIASAIMQQLTPLLDEKLPESKFNEYVDAHDQRHITEGIRYDERYESQIREMNSIISEMRARNQEQKENYILLQKAINDILLYQKEK